MINRASARHHHSSAWSGRSAARRIAPLFALLLAACGGDDADANLEAPVAGAEQHDESEGEVVVLDSAALANGKIVVEPVRTVRAAELPVTGTITYDANLVSHVGPRIEGRIIRLTADIGARVRAGQPLVLMESPQVGQVRAQEHEAEALLGIARENYERERRLEEQGISSRKELLDAQAELRRAEAALISARESLRVLGAGHGEGGQYALTAPFAGVVVDREANLGEMASPADRIFTIANLERLWIELDIYERDLARVRSGQDVTVTTAAYTDRAFPGRIVYVGDIVDPQTRTARARVEVPNPGGVLKPGMFATARIQVGEDGTPLLVVPLLAVQDLDGRKVVFVPGDDPGEFRARTIEVGDQTSDGGVVVLSGLESGQQVVTSGAFALRSELARGEIGEHGH